MTNTQKAYLAGFLDADGSIVLQFKKREGMRYLFRIKVVVVFYQDEKYIDELIWMNKIIKAGYVYTRSDRISELRIEGYTQVEKLLLQLKPFIRFKKNQVKYMLNAVKVMKRERKISLKDFLYVCDLADKTSASNYKSRRKYDAAYVRSVLIKNKIIPVTTESLKLISR